MVGLDDRYVGLVRLRYVGQPLISLYSQYDCSCFIMPIRRGHHALRRDLQGNGHLGPYPLDNGERLCHDSDRLEGLVRALQLRDSPYTILSDNKRTGSSVICCC